MVKGIYKTIRIKGENYLKLKMAGAECYYGIGELLDCILSRMSVDDLKKYVKDIV